MWPRIIPVYYNLKILQSQWSVWCSLAVEADMSTTHFCQEMWNLFVLDNFNVFYLSAILREI